MTLSTLIPDAYDRKSRLFPALLVAGPPIATVVAFLSSELATLQSLAALLVTGGGAFLLVQLGRDAGKSREPGLFDRWGGTPSVAILRHRDPRLDPMTKARFHRSLGLLVPAAPPPSVADEQSAPQAADVAYTAWSTFLRTHTRDKAKYPLVFAENVNYGYRRNVWGLRCIGVATDMLCCLALCGRLLLQRELTGENTAVAVGALALALAILVLWLARFTSDWVRIAADAYAARLVETVDTMST